MFISIAWKFFSLSPITDTFKFDLFFSLLVQKELQPDKWSKARMLDTAILRSLTWVKNELYTSMKSIARQYEIYQVSSPHVKPTTEYSQTSKT